MIIMMDMHLFFERLYELRKRAVSLVEWYGGNVWKNGWVMIVVKGVGS